MSETNANTNGPDPTTVGELKQKHPADAAELIEQLSREQGVKLLESMPPDHAADTLEQMHVEEAAAIVSDMGTPEAVEAVGRMEPDDAADVLAAMPTDERDELLAAMDAEYARTVRELMQYPEDSAGGLMTTQYVALPEHITVEHAIRDLRRIAIEDEDPIGYVYVIDRTHRLVGVLSLRSMLLAPGSLVIRDIMIREVVAVPATMDKEEVARLFAKYDFVALPVVDDDNHLLGVITVDDIVDVINEEAREDMQKMVGAGGDERIDSPVTYSLRKRLPWLTLNLATAFAAAAVVSIFEDVIARITLLAVLMPVVAGQAGNTGAQSLAVTIRGIALGELQQRSLKPVLVRQLLLGLISGAFIGLIAGAAVWIFTAQVFLACVMAVAMLAALMMATVAGAFVPVVMWKLGFDPAQCSSILLTTVTDCIGFGLFLGLAGLTVKLWNVG